MPVFLLSAAVFSSSCLEEEVLGRVVPIGDKESYSVNDTAIFYVMTGDTARVQVQFNLNADTVTGVDIKLIFEQADQAEDFFASYSNDTEIDNINYDGAFISYTTSNYDGLHRSEIISILKGKYVISEKQSSAVSDTPHDFMANAFSAPADGMYVIASRPFDDNSTLFWSGCSVKPQKSKSSTRSETNPWRLFRAKSLERNFAGRWYIQLSNGRYLRRSGNRLAPLALTTCTMPQQATAWNLQQIIARFNLWTLHTDITSTSDFYGITCGKDNNLTVSVNSLDTYSLLASPVTLQFYAKDEVINTIDTFWGCFTVLPTLDVNIKNLSAEITEGTTFIGWNTIPDQVEGYLAPGSIVEADNTTYHAIFVKSE